MAETPQPGLNRSSMTKLVLMGVFFVLYFMAIILAWLLGRLQPFALSWLDAVLLAFATMRMGRMMAFDKIAEPLRAPFTKTVPDRNGAGSIVVPRGEGVRRSLGELLSCPICIGTWIAALFVYGYLVIPAPTRVFVAVLAVIGLAELLHSATEALCWTGIHARAQAGVLMQKNLQEKPSAED